MVMQKLNSGSSSKILKLFLGLFLFGALMGLVLTDVGGFFRDGTGRSDVARVGNETISAVDFARTYQRRIEQAGITPEMARNMQLTNMVLQQEVERELLLQASRENGVRISNRHIANQLKSQLDAIQMVGTPEEKLQQVLMQQQMTEKQLVDLLRGDFSINLLASAVTTGDMAMPKEMVLAASRHSKQKRSADLIVISNTSVKEKTLTENDIEAFYNENKEAYRTAETRDMTVLVLPQSLFIKDIAVSDADIETFYQENADQFMTSERVRLEQIITKTEQEAKDILGKKPEALASFKTGDTQYLEADWYNRNGLPQEIADAVYKTRDTGLVGPVRTSLGWHVLLVNSYEDPKPRKLSEVKSRIERQLKDSQLDEHITALTNEIDSMVSNDASLDEVANKFGLKTVTIRDLSPVSIEQKLKAAKLSDDVIPRLQDAAFTLNADETSPLMDTPKGDYALARIVKINVATIPDLKSVLPRVKQDAEKSASQKNLQEFAEKLLGRFNAQKPDSFDKAVKDAGLSVNAIKNVTKADAEKRMSKEAANLLFSLTQDNALSYTAEANKITLVRLRDIVDSQETPSADEEKQVTETLRTTMLQEIQQQFTQSWDQKLGVRVNRTLLQNMFTNTDEQQ